MFLCQAEALDAETGVPPVPMAVEPLASIAARDVSLMKHS